MPITFEQISFTYDSIPKKRKSKQQLDCDASINWVLKDLSLTIDDTEFLGVAGKNGCGKSTLIQHMNGLLSPSMGRVLVDGLDISDKKNAMFARQKIGVVFQYPERQLFAETVLQDVSFGPRNIGMSEDDIFLSAKEAIQRVGLDFETIKDKSPFELSGGQMRRVAFAGILAMGPKILVLDEPLSGLDPSARSEMLELIDNLHESGTGIVMVSHNMDDIAAHCKRMIIISGGKIVAQGSPEEVFANSEIINLHATGVPTAVSIACELRNKGLNIPSGYYTAQSLAEKIHDLYQEG